MVEALSDPQIVRSKAATSQLNGLEVRVPSFLEPPQLMQGFSPIVQRRRQVTLISRGLRAENRNRLAPVRLGFRETSSQTLVPARCGESRGQRQSGFLIGILDQNLAT